ncbi:MAG: tetratricopeptide repeat protein [Treponema sp.]|nr:tetratricopeptide repeat protein [Treponema sp.]
MLFFRNLFQREKPDPDEIVEEKWEADFSRQSHARFGTCSESSHDVFLRKNLFYSGHSLVLAAKKTGCITWVESAEHRYRDLHISGTIRIDAKGGYGAGGMLFRIVDEGTHYSFLVSSKGYFRLDALRNGMPFPLVGWTELPLRTGETLGPDQAVDFSIIACGSRIVILIRGRWAAEVDDSSISEGTIGFAAVSYEPGDPAYKVILKNTEDISYMAEVFLESLTIDSRVVEVSEFSEKWRDSPDIDGGARFRLAETFAAMTQYGAAMMQIRKGWETAGHRKTQQELLLAGRLAQALGRMADAESHISQCFQADVESPEGKEAVTEMAKILYAGERFAELAEYCAEALKIKSGDSVLWTFLGHAHWSLKKYKEAAASYDRAVELDGKNGLLAKNAANVYDVMGHKKEALNRYLEAGRAFLQAGNYNDLGLLVPMFVSLGEKNHEARSLAGKWAFAVEDWKMAEAEFNLAENLRKNARPKAPKDGAQVFLEALLLIRAGKRREALPLLNEAASLEKNYALFHFRLAENLFILEDNPDDPVMCNEMNAALSLLQNDDSGREIAAGKENQGLAGWVNNFAAQVALRKGNLDAAAKHLEAAMAVLGDAPAVRVNRGVLFYLSGSLDKALDLLDADKKDDPEGIMANCAGNLLVRAGRFEEADEKYRKAVAAAPANVEYLRNRASCLMELGLYGEADDLLAKAHAIAPSPALLEMISFVAAKKGEYPRAEQACRSALEMDASHVPSLLSLGWICLTLGRYEESGEIIQRLDKLGLKDDAAKGRDELQSRLDDLFYRVIECASCDESWRVQKDPPSVPALRLFAMPPDNLPAGSCPDCGKTFCIGCAKQKIDSSGRFICADCGRSLKLVNEGLKKMIHDWAVKEGIGKNAAGKTKKPRKPPKEAPAEPAPKRGRPRISAKEKVPPRKPPKEAPTEPAPKRGRPPRLNKAEVPPRNPSPRLKKAEVPPRKK